MFYDKDLMGGGSRQTAPPLTIKTDLLASGAGPNWQTSAVAPIPAPAGAAKAVRRPTVGRAAAGRTSKVDADGGSGGGGKQTRQEGEGDLNDVNWSDDEALDALVDKLAEEVDGKDRR